MNLGVVAAVRVTVRPGRPALSTLLGPANGFPLPE